MNNTDRRIIIYCTLSFILGLYVQSIKTPVKFADIKYEKTLELIEEGRDLSKENCFVPAKAHEGRELQISEWCGSYQAYDLLKYYMEKM